MRLAKLLLSPDVLVRIVGGFAYHVLNRANGRMRLFIRDADFAAFERVLAEVSDRDTRRVCRAANHSAVRAGVRRRQDKWDWNLRSDSADAPEKSQPRPIDKKTTSVPYG